MALLFGKKGLAAGLSLSSDHVRYVELERSGGGLSVARAGEVELGPGIVDGEMIADVQALEGKLEELKSYIGGHWGAPVSLSLPSRDVLLRIVEMPSLAPDEAKEALKWDFEKYFPFPYAEAVFDLSPVDLPGEPDVTTSRFLVAAARLRVVEGLMEVTKRVGIKVNAVEPSGVPLYRSFKGAHTESDIITGTMVVSVGSLSSQIIVGFGDNGIIYRTLLFGGRPKDGMDSSSGFVAVAREVSSTFTYLASQFREMRVDEIILCGDYGKEELLKEELQKATDTAVVVKDPWEIWNIRGAPADRWGWETALGLAVRDLS
jgi:type IV pilus assembly protein PilM